MMMELDILLKSVSVVRVEGDTARNITGINMDSRLGEPGDLFRRQRDAGRRSRLYRQGDRERSRGRSVRGMAGGAG